MKPESHETKLEGNWLFDGEKIRSNETEKRIIWLIESYLNKIAISPDLGAWEILFQDSNDQRFWELTYPQSDMQGGGPKVLRVIDCDTAYSKYKLNQK